jgi:hypothetical protein
MTRKLIAALILGMILFTSCTKENDVRPVAPLSTFIGFKKDISTAD